MNKKLYLLPLAGLLLAGCSADDLAGTEGQLPISLTAEIEDMDVSTRAGTTVLNAFASGDAFYAYFPTNVRIGTATSASNTTFTLGSGSTWSPATQPYFSAGATSATVHAYYPYEVSGKQVTNTTSSFSVETDQTTEANYKKSDLMYATATINKGSSTNATGSLTFAHRMAKILVNANKGTGISKITAVKIVGGYRTINISTPQSCTLGSSTSNANSSTNITLYSNSSNTSNVSCAGLIPPQTINGNFLQIVTDQGTVTYSLSNKAFTSGNSYTLTLTVSAAQVGLTTTITGWNATTAINESVSPADSDPIEVVDLGLSVKWANMNVGAEHVTDYGTYFAWGETTGYIDANSSKTNFDWAHYRWNPSGDGSTFTKYNASDGKTVLDLADDAAHANWGGNWRMPTKEELNELYATKSNTTNYTWTWCDGSTAKYNNTTVKGWQVTKKATNATIFLPAAGYRHNAQAVDQGTYGLYRSSTIKEDTPDRAWYLYFYNNYANVAHGTRCSGYPVRPVYDPYCHASVGKLICASGHIHAYGADAGCTAERVAMIAYVGSDTGESAPYNHGLAISLVDCGGSTSAQGLTYQYKTENSSSGHSYVGTFGSFSSESGLQYRDATHNSDTYPAFQAAFSNNGATKPDGCSDWFLPTCYQWNQMISGMGSDTNLRDAFSSRGGRNMVSGQYWSSTEGSNTTTSYYYGWGVSIKTNSYYVRAVLAF